MLNEAADVVLFGWLLLLQGDDQPTQRCDLRIKSLESIADEQPAWLIAVIS